MHRLTSNCLALVIGSIPVAVAAPLDLTTPEGASLAMRKIQCSTEDNVPVTYFWHGNAYSRVPGEADRKLFRVEGMNIRQCGTVKDPVRGTGWRLVSREILLYIDPQTGEVLRKWTNPWTGKTVDVIQTANDPVNQPASFPIGRSGQPATWSGSAIGNSWWMTATIPLFYDNPLGGAYQQYVGGTYHATEMFNFMGNLDNLVSDQTRTADARVGWVRLASWLPWMEMGDRVGVIYMHTAGLKVERFSDLSATMLREIDANYPEYRSPPPTDDTRPNETSWTYFKKQVAPGDAAAH